ncbi:hypothetical protein PRZ48_002499 [Zasmidium cellare]|uniref:Svf1-like C-terminal domain-containing protein n=1 Tax=Zasmidium cellare TaxID=395010 RepID=A0ABR0F4Z7_ZASCE|nr:hypothetical protein PRZ48_002499 [Zasmidium cellare]
MFDWAKNAVGLVDKHHGASALHSVKGQTDEVPFTLTEKQDERWNIISSTCLESKTFYMTTDTGRLALVQVQFTNVLSSASNVKTTVQFGVKLFSDDSSEPHLWNLATVSDFSFPNDKYDFVSSQCAMKLSGDGKTYTVKSTVKNPDCTVDLKFTQMAPPFVVGKDGTTHFGDIKKPSGKMKHKFWPRSPTFSALSMEFTTPSSYDSTVVSVGCVAVDGKLILANANSTATHVITKHDPDSDLPEPKAITYTWSDKSDDGLEISAEIRAAFPEQRMDRIDVMDEMPKLLRGIVVGATGVQPFIYQNGPWAKIVVDNGGEIKEEEGRLYCEAIFIT